MYVCICTVARLIVPVEILSVRTRGEVGRQPYQLIKISCHLSGQSAVASIHPSLISHLYRIIDLL
jgi:hypothetical protein